MATFMRACQIYVEKVNKLASLVSVKRNLHAFSLTKTNSNIRCLSCCQYSTNRYGSDKNSRRKHLTLHQFRNRSPVFSSRKPLNDILFNTDSTYNVKHSRRRGGRNSGISQYSSSASSSSGTVLVGVFLF